MKKKKGFYTNQTKKELKVVRAELKNKALTKPAHYHKFVIERGGFDSKTELVSYLDMRCECGMPLFCMKPTTHGGDGPNRLLKSSEI